MNTAAGKTFLSEPGGSRTSNPTKAPCFPSDREKGRMKRKAFVMSVNAGMEEEYERRHSPIWPELESTLKDTVF